MKKTITLATLLAMAILAFGIAGAAFAHGPNPDSPDDSYPNWHGHMGGWHGGFGMMGWYDEGPMHDAMTTTLAEALGLTANEIEARHDAGETLWEIAEAEGLSSDEITVLMLDAHDQALDNAVAEGWLTAEQAEWMDEHMEFMWSDDHNGRGFGGHCGDDNSRWQSDN